MLMHHFFLDLIHNKARICIWMPAPVKDYDLDNRMGGAGHHSAHYTAPGALWADLRMLDKWMEKIPDPAALQAQACGGAGQPTGPIESVRGYESGVPSVLMWLNCSSTAAVLSLGFEILQAFQYIPAVHAMPS